MTHSLFLKLAATVAGLSLGAGALADDTASADRLLSEARQASGGAAWARIATLTEEGRFVGGGFSGRYAAATNLPKLLYRQTMDGGLATGGHGWSGRAEWSADYNGAVRIEDSREAVAAGLAEAYKAAYAFFWPERWPATRKYLGAHTADGVAYEVVEIQPRDASPFQLWIDPRTHLVARMADVGGSEPHTQILTDYREVQGVMLPFQVRDTMGDPKFDSVNTTRRYVLSTTAREAAFLPPAPPVMADPFPPGEGRVSLPFALDNNHIYVQVRVDGHPAAPFLFDTGAIDIVDARYAKSLGISGQGDLPAGGFGEDTASMGIARVKSLQLGDFTIGNQILLTMDLAQRLKGAGAPISGLLGYELPQRAVVTIDYARGIMTLQRPASFQPPAGAVAVPFKFNEHAVMIQASVNGIAGEFELDTGATAGLTLMGPFSAANHLAQAFGARRKVVSGQGIGGLTYALVGRAHELKIGSLVIDRPVALIDQSARGGGAAAMTAGNIGGGTLRRFTVTLDYGHRMIYLQPNASFASPDAFDRSGLRLSRQDDGSDVVVGVTDDSAAQAAGLAQGDRIVAIDGTPSAEISLSDLRDRFKQAPGTTFTLSVVTGASAPRSVSLALKDLID